MLSLQATRVRNPRMQRSRAALPFALILLAALRPPAAGRPAPIAAGSAPGPVRAAVAPLPFHYDLYTFRGRGGSTAVGAAFSVSAGLLHLEDADQGVRYRFDVTLVLADTALRTVARADDSVFVHFPRPPLAEHLLYTQVEMQARPSRTTLQRVIMTDATEPGIGQLYGTPFPVPDYSGARLMLSDVALGLPAGEGGWHRGEVTLALLPTSQFPASAFDVYYEIYNLPPSHPYRTEIAVEPAVPGALRPVRLRFAGEASASRDGVVPELRRVETSLTRGRYRITVTITDEVTGQSASRARAFEVRGWARGTTLVAALPRERAP
ncbi:MAG: hypothetical protein FIB01_13105 [Gemmatimonadetes bacterium]|nr:hypothetical protein [Gemmatimonadota bacterium]